MGADATRRARHEIDEIEVFPTGRTVARQPDEPAVRPDAPTEPMSDRIRRGGAALRDGLEHARDFHARPGHRPGGRVAPTTSNRQGGDTDIVRPVLIDPATACELAESGALFAEPVDRFRIEHRGGNEQRYLVWEAVVTTGRRRAHRATLHLLASPSMVVTVLELVPRRRLRRHRDRFVREGVAAVEELARRLETARDRAATTMLPRTGRRAMIAPSS